MFTPPNQQFHTHCCYQSSPAVMLWHTLLREDSYSFSPTKSVFLIYTLLTEHRMFLTIFRPLKLYWELYYRHALSSTLCSNPLVLQLAWQKFALENDLLVYYKLLSVDYNQLQQIQSSHSKHAPSSGSICKSTGNQRKPCVHSIKIPGKDCLACSLQVRERIWSDQVISNMPCDLT